MTAISANRVTRSKGPTSSQTYPVATATHIYAGTVIALNSGGFAISAAASAGNLGCVGVAKAEVNNTGADGALSVECEEGVFLFGATSITQAMTNTTMFFTDNQTFDETQGSNEPIGGVLKEFVSTTSGWIEIRPALSKTLIDLT